LRITRLLNSKASGTVGALEILESVDGNARGTGGELEKTRLLLSIPSADYLPEVLNDLVLLLVTAVVGMLLPVVDIDIGDTTDEQLKFALVKYVDKIRWNQFIESGHEGIELLLNSLHNLPFGNQSST
jgi:hypothetical protein